MAPTTSGMDDDGRVYMICVAVDVQASYKNKYAWFRNQCQISIVDNFGGNNRCSINILQNSNTVLNNSK